MIFAILEAAAFVLPRSAGSVRRDADAAGKEPGCQSRSQRMIAKKSPWLSFRSTMLKRPKEE